MSLFTLADLTRSLRAYIGNDTSSEKATAVRRCAASGVRALAAYADWVYYRTFGRITTVAAYSTGTVVYDHTGGASERLVTLTDGTFPSWAAYGVLEIDGVPYDVSARLSDTTMTLTTTTNPGADVAASDYRIYRMRYQLPADFVACDNPVRCGETQQLREVRVHDMMAYRNRNQSDSGGPKDYCFIGRPGTSATDVLIWPPSDTVYPLEFVYKRMPAQPTVEEEQRGTASLSTTTVTGVRTEFSQRHVGCVFRASYDSDPPEVIAGVNTHAHEATVLSVESATSLTLDSAPAAALSGVAYTLSSPLDVEGSALWDFLVELCRKQLRIELRINMQNEELRAYENAANAAMSLNGKSREKRVAGQCGGPTYPFPPYPRGLGW